MFEPSYSFIQAGIGVGYWTVGFIGGNPSVEVFVYATPSSINLLLIWFIVTIAVNLYLIWRSEIKRTSEQTKEMKDREQQGKN